MRLPFKQTIALPVQVVPGIRACYFCLKEVTQFKGGGWLIGTQGPAIRSIYLFEVRRIKEQSISVPKKSDSSFCGALMLPHFMNFDLNGSEHTKLEHTVAGSPRFPSKLRRAAPRSLCIDVIYRSTITAMHVGCDAVRHPCTASRW